jgi:hypothetical protein
MELPLAIPIGEIVADHKVIDALGSDSVHIDQPSVGVALQELKPHRITCFSLTWRDARLDILFSLPTNSSESCGPWFVNRPERGRGEGALPHQLLT